MFENRLRKKPQESRKSTPVIQNKPSLQLFAVGSPRSGCMVQTAVLRIRDILVWIRIRIRGSMLLTEDPHPDPDPAIFVTDLQDANKKLILKKI